MTIDQMPQPWDGERPIDGGPWSTQEKEWHLKEKVHYITSVVITYVRHQIAAL